jgi:hypothetical protein
MLYYFRRLPPLLRVTSLLALLFNLTALVVFLAGVPIVQASFPWWSMDAHRAMGISLNLLTLCFACIFVVNTYTLRFRRAGRQSYPLDTWPSQVRWLLLLGTLPLGVLTIAILLPRTPLFDFMLGLPTLLAMRVNGAALVYAADKWHALS